VSPKEGMRRKWGRVREQREDGIGARRTALRPRPPPPRPPRFHIMSVEAPPHPADAMDGIAPTLSSDAAPTAPNGAAPGPDDAPAEPEEPASETLYIQNLNERVRVTSA
jgi:hypothetical protein